MQYSKEHNDHMLVDNIELHINYCIYFEILVFIKQDFFLYFSGFITYKQQQRKCLVFRGKTNRNLLVQCEDRRLFN